MERTFILNPLSDEQRAQLVNRENRAHVQLGDWGNDLLPLLPDLKEAETVTIVFLSIGDLKLPREATWLMAWHAVLKRGLGLMPSSMVIPLRFAYIDQPVDDFVRLAHDDVMFRGRPHRFALHNPGTALLALGRESGQGEAIWPSCCRFGFLRDIALYR